jgi:hypothetical protein
VLPAVTAMIDQIDDLDDEQLLAAFDGQTISATGWSHRAHLRTAFVLAAQHPLHEAHLRLRAGIIRLNQRHGLVETGARGYFETLTFAWLCLVDDARRRSGASDSRACLAHCPELLDRALPLRHYSEEVLRSVEARAVLLPPDRAPLPGR